MDNKTPEINPLNDLNGIVGNLRGLIAFARAQANNPNLTPEQKQQVEEELKKQDFDGMEKQLTDSERKLKEKLNANTSK